MRQVVNHGKVFPWYASTRNTSKKRFKKIRRIYIWNVIGTSKLASNTLKHFLELPSIQSTVTTNTIMIANELRILSKRKFMRPSQYNTIV